MPIRRIYRHPTSIWATVGGKTHCFHSMLEIRWAAYLEILKKGGEIKDWFYEPRRFQFYGSEIPKNMNGKESGVRTYKPDFKQINLDDTNEWFETKGFFDRKDKTKMLCFRKYYPGEKMTVVMDSIPKGQTAKSRKKIASLEWVEQNGMELIAARSIFRQCGRLLNMMIQLGK